MYSGDTFSNLNDIGKLLFVKQLKSIFLFLYQKLNKRFEVNSIIS